MEVTKTLSKLSALGDGEEGDFFALLTGKEQLKTRDGKPYFRVTFRDDQREVSFPLWSDSAHATACEEQWLPGMFFKVRAVYRDTNYGPQLDILRIRETNESDRANGFDPLMLLAHSRFDPAEMWQELIDIAASEIEDSPLREIVVSIYQEHRETLLDLPAASRNHHSQVGGFLEHVLSVTRTAVYLADKYVAQYPDLDPPLCKSLVVAGAMLHDIGKLRELRLGPTGGEYTAAGMLIGHILQGRDMVREAAAEHPIDAEMLLRLEHLIVAHQRLPEWGSPKPPMTLEALIVHYADDLDAKVQMMVQAVVDDSNDGDFTSSRNPLHQRLYRGCK